MPRRQPATFSSNRLSESAATGAGTARSVLRHSATHRRGLRHPNVIDERHMIAINKRGGRRRISLRLLLFSVFSHANIRAHKCGNHALTHFALYLRDWHGHSARFPSLASVKS